MSSATQAAQLTRRDPGSAPAPLDFDALRSAGIRALQQLSGERWTDHNLHDPGITLLEAYGYALTELAYRTEAPLPELLASVPPEWLAHHPAASVLPCRASTAEDLRRWLLDRVPGLHDVRLSASRDGLWQAELHGADGAQGMARIEARVRRAYARQRMLGEDLNATLALREVLDCELDAEVELAGARDPAEVLAELLHVAQQQLASGSGDGADMEDALLARLRAVEGVADIAQLRLHPTPAGQALRLRLPAPIRLSRRGTRVMPDPLRVHARLADLREQAAPRHRAAPLERAVPAAPVERVEPWPYASLQSLLPPAFQLQVAANDPQAAALRGYLALFDQLLLDAQTQLQALPLLWAGTPGPSYWSREPGEAEVPGITGLRLEKADASLWRLDPAIERQHRALDAQLALHGQVYAQNTQAQFLPHEPGFDAAPWLLDNKAAFARQLPQLNGDRGAGLDPFVRHGSPQDRPSGLLQRMPLLLGLPESPPRLVDAMAAAGVAELRDEPLDDALPAGLHALPDPASPATNAPLPLHLPLPLLRSATQPLNWAWGDGALWLRGETAGRGWRMGDAADLPSAARLAAGMRAGLRPLQDASESLQLIDHILLRPRAAMPSAWHRQRASLLLPGWSPRTRQDAFFAFVEETVQHNAPAHVRVRCARLAVGDWLRLEAALPPWRHALRKWSQAPAVAARLRALDEASAALTACLPEALRS